MNSVNYVDFSKFFYYKIEKEHLLKLKKRTCWLKLEKSSRENLSLGPTGHKLLAMKSGTCLSHLSLRWLHSVAAALFYILPALQNCGREPSLSCSFNKILELTLTSWFAHMSTFKSKTGSLGYSIPFGEAEVMGPFQRVTSAPSTAWIKN